jgi:ATP-dependent RNA helicase DeaD
MSNITFKELGIQTEILDAISEMGYEVPSEIQEKSIPLLLNEDKDFVGLAQTGTGKTAAFGIPLLQKIDSKAKSVQALILTPTRELANQVDQEIKKFGKYTGAKTTVIYGGTSYEKQLRSLRNDKPQIVVGTPGRVIDLINKGYLKVESTKTCILDEADEMLNMGFFEDVQTILGLLKNRGQLLMFSATMPNQIKSLIEKHFKEHSIVTTKSKIKINENIDQKYFVVKDKFQTEALARLIESITDVYGMVFCKTKVESKEVGDILSQRGLNVDILNGDMGQRDRDYVMRKFKEKKINILVCTDVAARGIDVNNLTHVFNYGMAQCDEGYVHRIGRTGRAGHKGVAYTIVSPRAIGAMKKLERFTKSKITLGSLPSTGELKTRTVARELEVANKILGTISEKGEGYSMDESFGLFKGSFDKVSKDELIKLMYSWKFDSLLRKYKRTDKIELSEEEVQREDEYQKRTRGGRGRSRGGRFDRSPRRGSGSGSRSRSRSGSGHRGRSRSEGEGAGSGSGSRGSRFSGSSKRFSRPKKSTRS